MGKLITIDNGGTLTDVCVVEGARVWYTKTLTTPHDLTRCLVDGLAKVSELIYGEERLADLLATTDCLRYSTTQGTNALVERKGPRLGLVLGRDAAPAGLRAGGGADLLAALVGERVAHLDTALDGEDFETALVAAVNALTDAGASRIVVSLASEAEERFKRVWLRRFPRHLLGVVPVLLSREIADDPDDARRTWTAIVNAFLHPAMERFLYHAEHVLRERRCRQPLLVFRNDGDSARVAKTIALKTYASGPRGGMEGARALAAHHGVSRLLSLDVGGTTADVGLVEAGRIRDRRRGEVEGVPTSLALSDVVSIGAGGSSIIRVRRGAVVVGPQSVGAAPGPACFGLGGREATMTDALLVQGLLDPASYFGGDLRLDRGRAEEAVRRAVAEPLGIGIEQALVAMEDAWVRRIADGVAAYTRIDGATTLAAFGGAGPLAACGVAERLGIARIIIPGLAAVFSAFGIAFSDVAQQYEARVPEAAAAALAATLAALRERARRDMFAEGAALEACEQVVHLVRLRDGAETVVAIADEPVPPDDLRPDEELALSLRVAKPIPHPSFPRDDAVVVGAAESSATRRVHCGSAGWCALPLLRADTQRRGAVGRGPVVLEGPFFTCRVPAGWRITFAASGDILLERGESAA